MLRLQHEAGYLRRPIGFATSRAHRMKSCETGLSVRFFTVIIPTGRRVVGNSTGKRLIAGLSAENRNTELGMIVRKRPVASSALRTGTVDVMIVVGGRSRPASRKA